MPSVAVVEGVVVHEENGEAFVLHVASGRYFGLNSSGVIVWNALADGSDPVERLRAAWPDRALSALSADAEALIARLLEAGLVRGGVSQRRLGCHGVEVGGPMTDLGGFTAAPLAEATVEFGAVADPANAPMWTQTGQAAGVTVERSLHRTGDAQFTLGGNRGPRISVDVGAGLVRVAPGDEFVQRQLVAAFALPLLLHGTGVLLLHASACARNGIAVIVCGESGAGKSSALIALVDAGWAPISEDVCAVSFRDGSPVVWPGPPWVRVRPNEPGPKDAAVLASGPLKTAWLVEHQQMTAPVPIRQLVLLSRGAQRQMKRQSAGASIASVGPHAVWLLDQDAKGPQLFPLLARLSQVPVVELQLREEQAWRAALVDELDQVAFS